MKRNFLFLSPTVLLGDGWTTQHSLTHSLSLSLPVQLSSVQLSSAHACMHTRWTLLPRRTDVPLFRYSDIPIFRHRGSRRRVRGGGLSSFVFSHFSHFVKCGHLFRPIIVMLR
ncbi:hypothetical protein BKA81DRAFT_131094 [Phyllosticta paracitricarpa]